MGEGAAIFEGLKQKNSQGGCLLVKLLKSLYFFSGADTKSRTRDLLITSQLLYQLSYVGFTKNF